MSEEQPSLPLPSQDNIEAMKVKWGELHLWGNDMGQAIFRVPNAREFGRFLDEREQKVTKTIANRNLVVACAVWPEKDAFKEMIDARPGLVEMFAGELVESAGAKAASIAKKL